MIERGVPTPKPTANEAVHRLDAEAEAFMVAHAAGIIDAWATSGHPETYTGWNDAAVRQHWPELWTRCRALQQARDRLDALMKNAALRLPGNSRPG